MNGPILLKRHQIDDQAWNALIDKSCLPVLYAYTWYLDCVSPHWQALVLVESGERRVESAPVSDHPDPFSTDYKMVLPLPVRKKWGMDVIQQPLFCQYLGIFSHEEVSEAAMARFLEALNRYFPYISVYDFHPGHTALLRELLPAYPNFMVQEKTTHWLDMEKSYAQIGAGYSNDRTKNLKRARKYNWDCSQSEDIEPLIRIFQEHHASQIQNVQESAYLLLRKLAHLLLDKKVAVLHYAYRQGTPHAGVMILENNGLGIYIFNAADALGRKGNARTFLLDRYFQNAAGKLKTFDFESPEVSSIAQFYESFGATERAFVSIKKNKLPFPFRQLQNWRRRWLTST